MEHYSIKDEKSVKEKTAFDYARDYKSRGWSPIPIPHRSKHTKREGWENWIIPESEIPKYFNGSPQNIGVLLGDKSGGLVDIDLDSPEAIRIADLFLPETDAEFGRKSKPRSHRLYISEFLKVERFINPLATDKKQATVSEIRTTGGQTVFPGSTHESGERIEWVKNGNPVKVSAKQLRRAVALLNVAALLATVWNNLPRHDASLAVAGALLKNGVSLDETKLVMRGICTAAFDEEMSNRLTSVEDTAASIRNGRNVWGFPKLAELTNDKAVESICKWLEINLHGSSFISQNINPQEIEWTEPKPLDLTLKPVETVDDECLPEVLVNWLRPASKVIGCPFDFLVLSAIAIVGSLIGSRLRLKAAPNSDWFIVSSIYAGIIGLPSTKKTPALDETRKPILELQTAARKECAERKKDFEIEAKYYERETAAIYKNKDLNLDEIKTEINKLSEPQQPLVKRFEVNDITAPKLAQILNENPNGVLMSRDELTGYFKSLDADYNTNARPFMLELWKGALAYSLDRQDGREIQITSGTLSILGGIQPSKLQRYVSEAYSFDEADGFLQRFLFAYPDINRSEKPTAEDYKKMRTGYAVANAVFKQIAEFDFNGKVIGANGDVFHVVKFCAEAQKVIDEWEDEIKTEAESLQVEDEAFSAFLYKLPKNCFAVALIFHTLENIRSEHFSDEISLSTALKAVSYIEVLTTHARRVFALGENQIFSLAHILIGKIKKGELQQGFTAYEIKRKQWSGLKLKDTIQDVLKLLVDYEYLRELQTEGDGRPTNKFFFHPDLEPEVKANEVEE